MKNAGIYVNEFMCAVYNSKVNQLHRTMYKGTMITRYLILIHFTVSVKGTHLYWNMIYLPKIDHITMYDQSPTFDFDSFVSPTTYGQLHE